MLESKINRLSYYCTTVCKESGAGTAAFNIRRVCAVTKKGNDFAIINTSIIVLRGEEPRTSTAANIGWKPPSPAACYRLAPAQGTRASSFVSGMNPSVSRRDVRACAHHTLPAAGGATVNTLSVVDCWHQSACRERGPPGQSSSSREIYVLNPETTDNNKDWFFCFAVLLFCWFAVLLVSTFCVYEKATIYCTHGSRR